MKKLIGITGLAGSGKDTVADYLHSQYGFMKVAFADPLRLAASNIFGVDHRCFTDRKLKEEPHPDWGLSPRRLLQLLGNDAVKPVFGEEIWVKRWQMTYGVVKHSDHVVTPDVRFEPEATHIREQGGIILHLKSQRGGLQGETARHSSEAGVEILPGDHVIHNDGSFAELYTKVGFMLGAPV